MFILLHYYTQSSRVYPERRPLIKFRAGAVRDRVRTMWAYNFGGNGKLLRYGLTVIPHSELNLCLT